MIDSPNNAVIQRYDDFVAAIRDISPLAWDAMVWGIQARGGVGLVSSLCGAALCLWLARWYYRQPRAKSLDMFDHPREFFLCVGVVLACAITGIVAWSGLEKAIVRLLAPEAQVIARLLDSL